MSSLHAAAACRRREAMSICHRRPRATADRAPPPRRSHSSTIPLVARFTSGGPTYLWWPLPQVAFVNEGRFKNQLARMQANAARATDAPKGGAGIFRVPFNKNAGGQWFLARGVVGLVSQVESSLVVPLSS